MLSIFLCLNKMRVMGILVLPFERTKINVNRGMYVYECGYDAIKECDMWEIDGYNGGGALFQCDA